MGLFDFFKKKPVAEATYFDLSISDEELKTQVTKAVSVLEIYPYLTWKELVNKINEYCTNEDLALALYRFIPMVYCRLYFPEPAYSNEYTVIKNGKQETFLLENDRIYKAVMKEGRIRLRIPLPQQNLVQLLGHSADFNAINSALNAGSQMKDLVCGPSVFL